jgi:hypothetical protein
MPHDENISAHTIYILSAIELEEVMACVHELCARALSAQSTAILMWDADLEMFSDQCIYGDMKGEFSELVELYLGAAADKLAAYSGDEPPLSRHNADIRVHLLDLAWLENVDRALLLGHD